MTDLCPWPEYKNILYPDPYLNAGLFNNQVGLKRLLDLMVDGYKSLLTQSNMPAKLS
jgi:hypothetical protein